MSSALPWYILLLPFFAAGTIVLLTKSYRGLSSFISVAAAEVAVGLAIIVALYRARQTTHVEDVSSLKF